jgi:hypothetical protein
MKYVCSKKVKCVSEVEYKNIKVDYKSRILKIFYIFHKNGKKWLNVEIHMRKDSLKFLALLFCD